MSNQILSKDKIDRILKRIAYQIIENNFQEQHLSLVGITGQGFQMALRLQSLIQEIAADLEVEVFELLLDKSAPAREDVRLSVDILTLRDKVVIVIDDVMNTGRTQAYAVGYLLQLSLKKLETAVLVNRRHTKFPIAATYSGIALSTTLDEHIEVRLEDQIGAYLY